MMFAPPTRRRLLRSAAGFSLLEILVAAAVFSILLVGLLSMLNGTSILTNHATRHIDASSALRSGLDRLATDLENAVLDPDAKIYLKQDDSENSELHFLTRVDGYEGERRLAVVRYKIEEEAGQPGKFYLGRAAEGVTMNDSSLLSAAPPQTPESIDYDKLAPNVFRLFILPLGLAGDENDAGYTEYKLAKVAALEVRMAAVDEKAMTIAPETNWPEQLPGADITEWEKKIATLDFGTLPREAARGVQIRRKIFHVPATSR